MFSFVAGFVLVGVPTGFYLRENPNFNLKINTAPIREFVRKLTKE